MRYRLTAAIRTHSIVILADTANAAKARGLGKLLQQIPNLGTVKVYTVRNIRQLKTRLLRYGRQDLGIAFLFKGQDGKISIPGLGLITLSELAKIIGNHSLRNRHVHFGVDELLKGKDELKPFLKATQAKSISGYIRRRSYPTAITADSLILDALLVNKHLVSVAKMFGQIMGLRVVKR